MTTDSGTPRAGQADETQHTPGPWVVSGDSSSVFQDATGDPRWGSNLGTWIARIETTDTLERRANARLIAAAPETARKLAALAALVEAAEAVRAAESPAAKSGALAQLYLALKAAREHADA